MVFTLIIFGIVGTIRSHGVKNFFGGGLDELKNTATKIKEEIEQSGFTTCEYCTSKVKKSDEKCPNCGATITNKKNNNVGDK